MEQVFNILSSIENNSSRNTKKDILLTNKHIENLRKFLLYTYNPRWMYGIGSKSIKSFKQLQTQKTAPTEKSTNIAQRSLFGNKTSNNSNANIQDFDSIFDLCDYLKEHPFGSNKDIETVNNFLRKQSLESYNWYRKLLLKDLKIGCSAKTINEVFIDLIPEYEVMLAFHIKNYWDKLAKKGAFQLQRKYNGFRFNVFLYPDGTVRYFTRNGVELFDFPEFDDEFKKCTRQSVTMVLDGEATLPSDQLNDAQSKVMSYGPKTGLVFNTWDCITLDEFERKESFDKQFQRYDFLCSWLGNCYANSSVINIVSELYRGTDLAEIDKWYDYAMDKKWEGIMVKFDSPYLRKRTDNMLKVKPSELADLTVIRVNEGKSGTKYEGTLGSVTVLYKDKEVNVGGFNDYDRDRFWKNPNLIVDKTIQVEFFMETNNKEGSHSLQHPRYKGIRLDK